MLPPDFAVDADSLERAADRAGVEVRTGDIVLVRTGWALYWNEPRRFISDLDCPGINREAAGWLSTRDAFAGGSDTIAFEFLPAPSMPVHVHPVEFHFRNSKATTRSDCNSLNLNVLGPIPVGAGK